MPPVQPRPRPSIESNHETLSSSTAKTDLKSTARKGSILFLAMGMLALLSTLASSVFLMTRTDIRLSGNYKTGTTAFNQAEAGVHYVKNQIQQGVIAGTLSWQDPIHIVNYTSPTGFRFDPVTSLTRMSDTNTYLFAVTGRSFDSEATIEVQVRRNPVLQFGVFGNAELDLKAFANIYSYSSDMTASPTAADSDGYADTASNEQIYIRMGTYLNGTLAVGEDATGMAGILDRSGDPVVTGKFGLEVDHIEVDPLGAIGGGIETDIINASLTNDNLAVSPPITGPLYKIALGNGDSMTITSGVYYVKNIVLFTSATLDFDMGGGPITIYLTDSIEAKNGSTINISGKPGDLRIYSNSSGSIILKHSGNLKAMIYAPYASLTVMNTADAYGLFWADRVELKNSGDVFIDTTLTRGQLSTDVDLVSWKVL